MAESPVPPDSGEQLGCVLCDAPGLVVQRMWPAGPEGTPCWLCADHVVEGAPILSRRDERGATDVFRFCPDCGTARPANQWCSCAGGQARMAASDLLLRRHELPFSDLSTGLRVSKFRLEVPLSDHLWADVDPDYAASAECLEKYPELQPAWWQRAQDAIPWFAGRPFWLLGDGFEALGYMAANAAARLLRVNVRFEKTVEDRDDG